ncbi:hypothetical protein R5R35_012935 [Gryllus longicercus]|uniref:SCP domain-containing protein n=1 Tax=Gryllus longicercus TaxID=2509291 RepID=A0AAN9W112_9ORTH
MATVCVASAAALLLLSIFALSQATTKDEYCHLCSTHTMCQYTGVSSACRAGRWEHGVPADQQGAIVEVHNKLRDQIAQGKETRGSPGPQPPAANMLRMTWDDELAQVAQRWADQCNYQHDACRNVPRFYVGQNLYIKIQWPCSSMDSKQYWEEAILAWYNEVAQFDKNSVGSLKGASGTGHYTQVVWANTNRVGCGFSLFQDGNQCKKYYVCNYGPGGNILTQPVYKAGTARSACPSATARDARFPNLC